VICLHPFCPRRFAPGVWEEAVDYPSMKVKQTSRAALLADLNARFTAPSSPAVSRPPPSLTLRQLKTLLGLSPCLFNQVDIAPTARGIVHFCEIALGGPVTSANVYEAFLIQHPKAPGFTIPPLREAKSGGRIMEILCSEVLSSAGIPAMKLDDDGWPEWTMPGHALLNEGKMAALKALGDILVPCAPTNIVISVKSEVARERLLYSANSIEGIGFGFFREPQEFWTVSRMSLFKRMGFSAIYMPDGTHKAVMDHLAAEDTTRHAVNINGSDLYRPLSVFGDDMKRVVGRSSTLL
jgi:hypothetical protein